MAWHQQVVDETGEMLLDRLDLRDHHRGPVWQVEEDHDLRIDLTGTTTRHPRPWSGSMPPVRAGGLGLASRSAAG
ncbi:MAG: hypothetical protein INR70_00555 [Parafilimonas terrae]|nr:hypothetical protein [Parafilimonas terrae]